ncbi:peptidase domain-containing ABC transporter [Novosphingopyxis sp.]|uniref:peptidase domain-containing ABC transporter n=1 Tax=Novosphingopyxis sp. TaxID=2709690 RepID=UPI003B58E2B2
MNLHSFGRRHLPVITQDSNGECGLACLTMIAAWHGHRLDLSHLRASYPTTHRGLSLANLAQIAEQLKFDVRGYQIDDLNDLARVRLPAVLHWDNNHFVVLKSVRKRQFEIHNPAVGARTLQIEDVREHFSGFVLEVQPSQTFKIIVRDKQYPLSKILELTHGLRTSLIQVISISLVGSAILMLMPLFVQAALDSVLPRNDVDLLAALAVGLLMVSLTSAIADYLRSRIIANVGGAFFAQLTRNAFGHILRLPLRYFESRHPGDIATRLESVDQVRNVVTQSVVAATVDAIMIVLSGTIMFLYAPMLAIIVTSIFILVIAIRLWLYPKMRRQGAIALAARSEERSKMIDGLRAIASVKTANATIPIASRWYDSFVRYVNASFRIQMTEAHASLMVEVVTAIGMAATLYLGVAAVLAQELTVGMLYAFFTYRSIFFDRIDSSVTTMTQVSMLGANMGRLTDFLEVDTEPSSNIISREIRHGVELRDVSFKAGFADKPILKDVNLRIDCNQTQTISILGPSGSGKTTLLKIMAGLYQPSSGTLEVDGTPVASWALTAYRSNIGLVLGSDKLMFGTLTENITSFAMDPDMPRVHAALRVACLLDEAKDLDAGLESIVSEENGILSSGQRRRLMLARALYTDPPILLLDEVTSNLDAETSARVLENLSRHPATKIITSHDLAVLKVSDCILRMEAGTLHRVDGNELVTDHQREETRV